MKSRMHSILDALFPERQITDRGMKAQWDAQQKEQALTLQLQSSGIATVAFLILYFFIDSNLNIRNPFK